MGFLVETVMAVTDRPVLIDTTNPRAIRAGLKAAGNQGIVNGISLAGNHEACPGLPIINPG